MTWTEVDRCNSYKLSERSLVRILRQTLDWTMRGGESEKLPSAVVDYFSEVLTL